MFSAIVTTSETIKSNCKAIMTGLLINGKY